MLKPGKDDRLAIAVVLIMGGTLFAAVGFMAFWRAVGQDLGVAQFFAGYTLILGGIGHLWLRSQMRLIQTILRQSQGMIAMADQQRPDAPATRQGD